MKQKDNQIDEGRQYIEAFFFNPLEAIGPWVQDIIDHIRKIERTPLNSNRAQALELLQVLKIREFLPPRDLVRERYFTTATLRHNKIFNVPQYSADGYAEYILKIAQDIESANDMEMSRLIENAYYRNDTNKGLDNAILKTEYIGWKRNLLFRLLIKEKLLKHGFKKKHGLPNEMIKRTDQELYSKLDSYIRRNLKVWLRKECGKCEYSDLLKLEADMRMRWIRDRAAHNAYRRIRGALDKNMKRLFILWFTGRHVRLGQPPSEPFNGLIPAFDKALRGFNELVDGDARNKMEAMLILKQRDPQATAHMQNLFAAYMKFYPFWAEIMIREDKGQIPRSDIEEELMKIPIDDPLRPPRIITPDEIRDTEPEKRASIFAEGEIEALIDQVCTPEEARAIKHRFLDKQTQAEISCNEKVSQQMISKRIKSGIAKLKKHRKRFLNR